MNVHSIPQPCDFWDSTWQSCRAHISSPLQGRLFKRLFRWLLVGNDSPKSFWQPQKSTNLLMLGSKVDTVKDYNWKYGQSPQRAPVLFGSITKEGICEPHHCHFLPRLSDSSAVYACIRYEPISLYGGFLKWRYSQSSKSLETILVLKLMDKRGSPVWTKRPHEEQFPLSTYRVKQYMWHGHVTNRQRGNPFGLVGWRFVVPSCGSQ